jgi:glycogen operon protein
MGDEVRRTQGGNNNAYCQDNETSWFDWNLLGEHADVFRFVRLMIRRRLMRDVEQERRRMMLSELLEQTKHALHGVRLNQPDLSPESHSLALSVEPRNEGLLFHVILNAYWEALDFELPAPAENRGGWRLWIDTAREPPDDIREWNEAVPVPGRKYRAGARSVAVLIANAGRRNDAPAEKDVS